MKHKNILSLTFVTILTIMFAAPFVFRANLNSKEANIIESYIVANSSLK